VEPVCYIAAVLAVATLAASMLSVKLGLSVAVIEICLGVAVGNTLHLTAPQWLVFLASFGSVVLTFLAGAEVDPDEFRGTWRASVLIGTASFTAPFAGVLLLRRYGFGWTWKAAEIGGTVLSTTSLAVVYAVLVETGLNVTAIGKLLMSATFVTDLATVIALSVLFSLEHLAAASAEQLLKAAADRLDRPCTRTERTGRVEREVVVAAEGADLLILARDGDRTSLGPHSLGPASRFVVDHAPCPLLLVWPEPAPGLTTIPPPPPHHR
jgi:nucleotide-binding universal stress UspA family protein